jgi:DNA invertase Pin-like site-specific DNA recombinase
MIKDSERRQFEVVLVWKLDRFSRNRYDSAHYKHLLQKNNVHVVSATEPISNTPEGIILESMLEGMAEYYSAELSEKIKRGNKENALKGKASGGHPPLGYVIDANQHYAVDPDTAPIVREIYERYAAGETTEAIAKELSSRGLRTRTGKPFVKNSFYTILGNRKYIGEFWYKNEQMVDIEIPPIVSRELFDKVQARMKRNKMAAASAASDENFILTTKLFCGKCGSMMSGESGTSHTGAKHCYYKCSIAKRKGKSGCSLKAIRKEPLERFVVHTAVDRVLRDDTIANLTDMLLQYTSPENTKLPVLKKELADVEKRIGNLINAIELGIINDSTKKRMDELDQRKKELSLAIIQEQIEKPLLTRVQILAWFEQFKHGDINDPDYRQRIVDAFVNSVYVFDDSLLINFNAKDGAQRVSLDEVLGSSSDGLAPLVKILDKS